MKIILTGATGFVGSEVLTQLLQRDEVDGITCLTRHPPTVASPKLRVLMHEDFTSYPDELAEDLAQHDAMMWALARPVHELGDRHPLAVACAVAIAERLTNPFRFGHLTGIAADPEASGDFSWQLLRTRRIPNQKMPSLQSLTEQFPNFRATRFRPGRILPKSTSRFVDTLLAPIAVRVDRLAFTMIEESIRNVAERYAVLDNSTIRKIGDPSH